ncbi:hypothetical protein O7623_25930 [Solwaraspora sp. WMMD791]|uniref:hypothetical protein n=1 Tax=Solwaraspora sp. WMMD791 TaxID=3016086 RepID=UPI00249B6F7B|nr:hypothetical protein [Solwaraspora sp. WMMD791]WFE26690.1 hypothetical protein O7623_25930 [Solwaraspora sp. WMMD791]
MTGRLFLTELRRTGALWFGIALAGTAAWLTADPERWDGAWMATVLAHHAGLDLLWPLALAAGAWQGRRDRAAGIVDLLAGTARPGWSRVAPQATVVAGCLAGGYVGGLLDGLGRALLAATYHPPGWYGPLLLGALSIAAAGLLGLGVGRLLPSRLTAPLLALAGLAAIVVVAIGWADSYRPVLLLGPAYLGDADQYSMIDGRVVAGKLVWFTAIAGTGFALYAAGTRRSRLLATIPTAVGLVAALALFPPTGPAVRPDPEATALVCTDEAPRVCVTRLHEPALAQIVDPARRALALLSRLPDAPTQVVEEPSRHGTRVEQRRDSVHLELVIHGDGTVISGQESIEASILDGAGTWACGAAAADVAGWEPIQAARAAASLWLQGRDARPDEFWPPVQQMVADALARLRALPPDEQVARVAALRAAALDCRPDLYDVLTGS